MENKNKNKNKVICRIVGGLGNQLFCYAAARRLALVNNAELIIDDVSGFTNDLAYRRNYQLDHFNISSRKATYFERFEPFSRPRRFFKRAINQLLPFRLRRYIQQDGDDFDSRLLNARVLGNLYLEGYWQSESYFKDVEASIRDDLKITPPEDIDNLTLAKKIQSCTAVAVHVRFFDGAYEGVVNNASHDYYTRAIAHMENLVPNAHYFIFSDQPKNSLTKISLPNSRVTSISNNKGDDKAYADLWLMAQCDHFIIANSTFSWWGAWLSSNSSKYVIAPAFEMKFGKTRWGFKGLLPSDWVKL